MKGEVVFTDHMFLDYYASKKKKKNYRHGCTPCYIPIAAAACCEVQPKCFKWFRVRKQMGKKWCEVICPKPHTFSYEICFSSCRKVKENYRCLFLFYWVVLIQNSYTFFGKEYICLQSIYDAFYCSVTTSTFLFL